MRAMIVEQLGLAMRPPWPALMPLKASGLTSGMTSGTPSCILNAELLSTTCIANGLIVFSALHFISSLRPMNPRALQKDAITVIERWVGHRCSSI